MSQTDPLSAGTQISGRASDVMGDSENITEISQPPPRKRRRPALACTECRRRKIRCDRQNPCTQCVQWKCSSCIYTPLANHLLPNRAFASNGPKHLLWNRGRQDIPLLLQIIIFSPLALLQTMVTRPPTQTYTLHNHHNLTDT